MAIVTEMWSVRTLSRGKSAVRGFDVTGVTSESEAEDALPSSVAPGQTHPLDTTIKIPLKGGISWQIIVPGKHYRCTVNYENPDGSTGDGALIEKWKCRVGWQTESVAVSKDGRGILVANAAGDVFQNAPAAQDRTLEIEIWRWESGEDVVAKSLAYSNRYNTDVVTLPKIGTLNPGEALIKQIFIEDEFATQSSVVKVRYNILARPLITLIDSAWPEPTIHGFHRRQANLGTRTWKDGDAPELVPIVHISDTSRPVREPVRLDPEGLPVDLDSFWGMGADTLIANPTPFAGPWDYVESEDTYYLYFDYTGGGVAFSGLDIDANN